MKKYCIPKFLTCIVLFLSANLCVQADATFLSNLPFTNAYADIDIIANTEEYGIEKEAFLNFLFSEDVTLGEKTALISALSIYCEWNNSEEENYYPNYIRAFTARLFNQYDAMNIDDKRIPAEYALLYYLLFDYDTTSPSLKNYEKMAQAMPQSLTAQTIMVFSQAYHIIYNLSRTMANQRKFAENYLNPFHTKLPSLTKDIRLQAVQEMMDWTNTLVDCLPITYLENLACHCEYTDEASFEKCLQFAIDKIETEIKGAKLNPCENLTETEFDSYQKTLLECMDSERALINTLSTSNLNKAALFHFYLKQINRMVLDADAMMAMGTISYDESSNYMITFGETFFSSADCIKMKEKNSSFFLDKTPIHKTACFKNYMNALDKDLNLKYKELGGSSNTLLKAAEQNWMKLRDLYLKGSNTRWEEYDADKAKDILATRVASLHYYSNLNEVSEMYDRMVGESKR